MFMQQLAWREQKGKTANFVGHQECQFESMRGKEKSNLASFIITLVCCAFRPCLKNDLAISPQASDMIAKQYCHAFPIASLGQHRFLHPPTSRQYTLLSPGQIASSMFN